MEPIEMTKAADDGDAELAFTVAMTFKDGTNGVRDLKQYARYIQVAADAETESPATAATVALASLLTARGYKHGNEGFERDDEKSRYYYLRAANGVAGAGSGHPLAARKVGEWLLKGQEGFNKDETEGWRLLLEAARKEDGPAMMQVAVSYLDGLYAPADLTLAGQYLLRYITRKRNEKEVRDFADYGALERKSIELYTDRILENDPKKCIEFLQSLPDNFGAPYMQAALLGWYYAQLGMYEVALPFVRRGLKCNDSSCCGLMGMMYAYGLGVSQDFSQAKYYWELGADGGDQNCVNALDHFDDIQKYAKGRNMKVFEKRIAQFLNKKL